MSWMFHELMLSEAEDMSWNDAAYMMSWACVCATPHRTLLTETKIAEIYCLPHGL